MLGILRQVDLTEAGKSAFDPYGMTQVPV